MSDGTFLVLLGRRGMAIRQISGVASAPPLLAWWRSRHGSESGLHDYLVANIAAGDAHDRAAALEFQLRCPLEPRGVAGADGLPAAEIDLAIATGAGTLVRGWYRDPLGLVEGIDALDRKGQPEALDERLYRFPASMDKAPAGDPVTGFVALAPGGSDATRHLQPRFLLRLTSGARYLMVPPRQPADAGEARARALQAVPVQHLTDELLTECLGPALADLQSRFYAGIAEAKVVEIGEPMEAPAASVVVPLYKVLDFLRVQVAAFAADPAFAECRDDLRPRFARAGEARSSICCAGCICSTACR